MRLRTRVDAFGTALLSALGAAQLIACGGSTSLNGGTGGTSAANGGVGGASTTTGGSAQSGSSNNDGGRTSAGSGQTSAGSGPSSAGSGPNSGGSGGNAGAAGAGTAGAAGAGGGNTTSNRFPCKNPKDLGNGFEQCDGFKHRKQPQMCVSHVPRPEQQGVDSLCTFDADCTEKPHGWCSQSSQGSTTICQYGCVTSSDCLTGQACDCVEPVGKCVRADCDSDAECADGFLCKGYDSSGGCGLTAYTCQSSTDSCGSDADCSQTPAQNEHCRYDATLHSFRCVAGVCAIGRPFLVEGSERLANSSERGDWSELSRSLHAASLDPLLREQLAQSWTRVALMEHASIAAFARFALQLMSLGAPASLIEGATAAMSDETKHAKACFAIANQFGSTPVGPGRLAIEHSLDDCSLEEIVLNTIREGCVGETIAAIEAREAAEYAEDPALRALLLEISEDETRHAELAYRFVQWALSLAGPALERAVKREFTFLATRVAPERSAPNYANDALLRHGIVPASIRQLIREQTIAQVVLPCAYALFGAGEPSASASASAERS